MTRKDLTVKFYQSIAKKRYLDGKYVYISERILLPIPSKLHCKIENSLNQRHKIGITKQKGTLIIKLTPVKSLLCTESPPDKTQPKRHS